MNLRPIFELLFGDIYLFLNSSFNVDDINRIILSSLLLLGVTKKNFCFVSFSINVLIFWCSILL